MGHSLETANFFLESRLAEAARGNPDACFDLGVAYSAGRNGAAHDLVEAHKWFNLAAVNGSREAQLCRADIACEMSAREIAEAQRQARAWLQTRDARAA
jgi:TPR repeat protein